MTDFKTMLAVKGTEERLKRIFSKGGKVFVSPKLDGVRCLVHPDLGPVTRTLKPIPNLFIRKTLSAPEYEGFDGEIIAGKTFQDCQSAVMTHKGEPSFYFHVFDKCNMSEAPFDRRLHEAEMSILNRYPRHAVMVHHKYIDNMEAFNTMYNHFLMRGHEGIMVRIPDGPYKHGRSTLGQAYLMKFKPLARDEAMFVGVTRLVDKFTDVHETVGSVEGMVINGKYKGVRISLGSGFTRKQRYDIFNNRKELAKEEAVFTFEYQEEGAKDKPRFPIFIGFRDRKDFD